MPDHCTSCCPLLAPPPKPPGWPILLEGQRRLGAPRRRMAPREPSFGIREDLLPLVLTPQHQAEPSRSPSGRPWLREGCAEEGPFAWCFPAAPTGLSVYLAPQPPGSATRHGFSSHLTPQLAAAILAIPRGGIAVLSQPHRSGDPTPWPAQGAHLSGSARRAPSPQGQRLSRGPPFLFSESGSGSPPPAFPPSPRQHLLPALPEQSGLALPVCGSESHDGSCQPWACKWCPLAASGPSTAYGGVITSTKPFPLAPPAPPLPPTPAPDKWVLLPSSW